MRLANLRFGNALLDRELNRRDARKRDQEGTARALMVASGALMTILLALAKDAGMYRAGAPSVARGFFILSLTAAVSAAICSALAQHPRKYARLGAEALDHFNKGAFLDAPEHEVEGRTLSAKIRVAKRADKRHEDKAKWLIAAFICLLVAFGGVLGQGADLAFDSPSAKPSSRPPKLSERSHASNPAAPSSNH